LTAHSITDETLDRTNYDKDFMTIITLSDQAAFHVLGTVHTHTHGDRICHIVTNHLPHSTTVNLPWNCNA